MVGAADATELEAMALPSSDPAAIASKEEALLTNFHQRFKKDFVYVSRVLDFFVHSFFSTLAFAFIVAQVQMFTRRRQLSLRVVQDSRLEAFFAGTRNCRTQQIRV
jgi:hypothetical protein